MSGNHEPILVAENISKRFEGRVALDNASLAVQRGSITGVIGPERLGQVDAVQHHRRHTARPTAAAC